MSRTRHTEAEIIAVLKQVEAGRKAEDVAREAVDTGVQHWNRFHNIFRNNYA